MVYLLSNGVELKFVLHATRRIVHRSREIRSIAQTRGYWTPDLPIGYTVALIYTASIPTHSVFWHFMSHDKFSYFKLMFAALSPGLIRMHTTAHRTKLILLLVFSCPSCSVHGWHQGPACALFYFLCPPYPFVSDLSSS